MQQFHGQDEGQFWIFWAFFGSIWVGDLYARKDLGKFKFLDPSGQKFKIRRAENLGYGCRNGSISQNIQIFGERSTLMKCSILFGDLSGSIHFYFQKCLLNEEFKMKPRNYS